MCIFLQCVSGIWTSLTWLWWIGFSLEPIISTAQAASKRITNFKSDQKCLKNNYLAFLVNNPWHTLYVSLFSLLSSFLFICLFACLSLSLSCSLISISTLLSVFLCLPFSFSMSNYFLHFFVSVFAFLSFFFLNQIYLAAELLLYLRVDTFQSVTKDNFKTSTKTLPDSTAATTATATTLTKNRWSSYNCNNNFICNFNYCYNYGIQNFWVKWNCK